MSRIAEKEGKVFMQTNFNQDRLNDQKRETIKRRITMNIDVIAEMIMSGEQIEICPSRSGCKFFHGLPKSRDGFEINSRAFGGDRVV